VKVGAFLTESTEADIRDGIPPELLFGRLDALTRVGNICLVLVLGAGFLIVSIHNESYGIVQFDPFRIRMVSAGVLFLVLLAIPFLGGSRIHGLFGFKAWMPESQTQNAMRPEVFGYYLRFARTFEYLIFAFVLAFWIRPFLENYATNLKFALVGFVFVAFGIAASMSIKSSLHKMPVKCATLAALTMVLCFAVSVSMADVGFLLLLLWLFVAGAIPLYIQKPIREPQELRNIDWHIWLGCALAIVALFAAAIYPRISPLLGGGAPVRVILQFEGRSPIDGAERARVLLVDETEGGFYIVQSEADKRAVFLPRERIAAIYFKSKQEPDKLSVPLDQPSAVPTYHFFPM
jgi:hypothetical protein